MSHRNSELWDKARRARDKLADEFINHSDVSLIDIGISSEKSQSKDNELVLRIHARQQWINAVTAKQISFPKEIDGFEVVVIPGDYKVD